MPVAPGQRRQTTVPVAAAAATAAPLQTTARRTAAPRHPPAGRVISRRPDDAGGVSRLVSGDLSANARSPADWKRFSGRFSRQRLTIVASAGETPLLRRGSSGGSLVRMAVIVSATLSPLKARFVVSSSYRT